MVTENSNADRWPITAEDRQRCVDTVMRILDSPDPREQLAAVRCVLAMDEVNRKAELNDDSTEFARRAAASKIQSLLDRRNQKN